MATVQNPHSAAPASEDTAFFGHPRGLSTLFFTEMWERFSYYGMRALLVLFMTTPLGGNNPGMGLGEGASGAIYGIYTAMVYLVALPGGWIADKLWGQRRSVFVGGCVIAAGHFSMAIPYDITFYLGLGLIVLGTGLLKPNVSAMVGDLYPEGGARRDAGYSVYYMGINLGAFFGPTLCGLLGEGYSYHLGFSLAGIGMVAGLIQYQYGGKFLGSVGQLKTEDSPATLAKRGQTTLMATVAMLVAIGIFTYLVSSEILPWTITDVAEALGYSIFLMMGGFFLYLFVAGGLNNIEKKRLWVIVWLAILSAVFWAGFEQAGSSMNIFARDLTTRDFGFFEVPASWLQNVNAFFIVVMAPLFGMLWTWLARKNANPSIPMKFALGLFGLTVGFLVLAWGSANATETARVSMAWLVVTYFFHTAGELCLSPVGLSSMTKLAPAGRVSQMMGVWFVASALGSLVAGLFAGQLENLEHSALFWNVALITGAAGVVGLMFSPFVKRLTGGVD